MTLLFLRRGIGCTLQPMTEADAEIIEGLPWDTELTADVKARRSNKRNSLYWITLHNVLSSAALGDTYPSAQHLHDGIKLALGYTTPVLNPATGEVTEIPDSTSFHRMGEDEFRPFFDRAMSLLARMTGVDPLNMGDGE